MRSLYAAFDRFPSAKGAATHIARFAPVVLSRAPGVLYVLGGPPLPARQVEGDIEIVRFQQEIPSLLERGVRFGQRLSALIAAEGADLELAQFRDPWSGVAILSATGCRTVYELNGLPSIELPEHRPRMAPQTIAKLDAAERWCLEHADIVVCPSVVQADAALARGARHVEVIPNGADPVLTPMPPRPPDVPADPYVLYFGALQPWQGVDTLLEAMAQLTDVCTLVVCASQRSGFAKPLRRRARKLGLDDAVWRFELDRDELAAYLRHATLTVAPLTDCPRNAAQGCAPLKILESMAAGVPVVASDLPAVREIVGADGLLVAPDRPGQLARAIRLALEDPARRRALSDAGRNSHFTWERSVGMLADVLNAGVPA